MTQSRRQLAQTQPLPSVETMADLVATDPARYYSHRTRIERVIPLHKPARKWRLEGLERLLRDLGTR
jgi:hypothetical protein